jgi:FixJ family two-component response regulator
MSKAVVLVLDDDAAIRASLASLLEAEDYQVHAFDKAAALLGFALPPGPACLILDMQMPELCGLDVMAALAEAGIAIPVVFLTGFASIPLTVQAMKAGANEFLTKPVLPERLLEAVGAALASDSARLDQRQALAELRARHASLTPREQETMALVIGGLLNKQVADALGVSEIMAKMHKKKVMEKMRARSLPDLVRGAERLNIASARSR